MNKDNQDAWVTIRTFNFPQDCYTAKAFLESAGIHVFLKDELTTQVAGFYSYALGGVKMLVPREEAEEALGLLHEAGFDENE